MYAVVKTGGKQYKVAPGEKLKIEQIPADVGAEVIIDQVLMVGDGDSVRLGQPLVAGATVTATVLSQGRHDKVQIFILENVPHLWLFSADTIDFTQAGVKGFRQHPTTLLYGLEGASI